MSFTSSHSRGRLARTAASPLPIYLFIAYAELRAARDAIERAKDMLGRTTRGRTLHPMLWRFDQLEQPRWREMALHDAQRAHAIVLAMGNASTLDAGAEEWLAALAQRAAGSPIHCLVLMRDGEPWTISLQRSESPERVKAHPTHRTAKRAA